MLSAVVLDEVAYLQKDFNVLMEGRNAFPKEMHLRFSRVA